MALVSGEPRGDEPDSRKSLRCSPSSADDDNAAKASTVAGVSRASTAAAEASFAMEREAVALRWPSNHGR
jgi:hypothetical protein